MKLNPCKDCGHQISTKAKSCPQCGSPQKQKTSGCAWIFLAFVVFCIFAFTTSFQKVRQHQQQNEKKSKHDKEQVEQKDHAFSPFMICKATVSKVMGTDPHIIKKDKVSGNIVFLSYKRESDGKQWAYKCKIIGNTVVWATATGRWRDSEYDSSLTYEISGDTLIITERHTDASEGTKIFTIDQLN